MIMYLKVILNMVTVFGSRDTFCDPAASGHRICCIDLWFNLTTGLLPGRKPSGRELGYTIGRQHTDAIIFAAAKKRPWEQRQKVALGRKLK